MNYTAYTPNTDGSINILAGSTNPAVFPAILPAGTEYEVHKGETFTAGGKTYLSDTDPAYIEAKAQEEKDKALSDLDTDYNTQKADLISEYTDAQIHGDEDTIALVQEEMTELDEWYDEEYRKIEEGEAE